MNKAEHQCFKLVQKTCQYIMYYRLIVSFIACSNMGRTLLKHNVGPQMNTKKN